MSTILVVDDNPYFLGFLADGLSPLGHKMLYSLNGEMALKIAAREIPDLILLDIGLPGMDGWEATELIRANDSTKHLPIIALTAHAMAGDREKAIEVGCDDYETKPIDFPRLLEKMGNLLNRDTEK